MTLNYSTSQFVNFEVINDMALERPEKGHVTVHTEIEVQT